MQKYINNINLRADLVLCLIHWCLICETGLSVTYAENHVEAMKPFFEMEMIFISKYSQTSFYWSIYSNYQLKI